MQKFVEKSDVLFVSGYGVSQYGTVQVLFKSRKQVNPLFPVGSKYNGSRWMPKGVTLADAKAALPVGQVVEHAYCDLDAPIEGYSNTYEVRFVGEEDEETELVDDTQGNKELEEA